MIHLIGYRVTTYTEHYHMTVVHWCLLVVWCYTKSSWVRSSNLSSV